MSSRRPKIGLALGSGAARGWAHIGAIRVLEEHGIIPDVVTGTSAGAIVGAVYVADALNHYETWARTLDRRRVIGYFDFAMRGGLIRAQRIFDHLQSFLPDCPIESLARPFATVATDLRSGHEVWLRNGRLIDCIRASSAMPGLIPPVLLDGRWLTDGGLVMPVPVALARALGADMIIAVDLNAGLLEHRAFAQAESDSATPPTLREIIGTSLDIVQERITRSAIAGAPPDVLITPRLGNFGFFDFHRVGEAIEEGARAARHALASGPTALIRTEAAVV